ncbi:RHS repeat-associated core domain-containing protein [Pseudomonas sp. WJP1]|uniref:RHS repeat-associated core domain-containing protein n=1 Tax=Pseudomonas sp. WJP1 TaxID=2986947 RepID=UPI00234AEEBA|nr:RHS repeat-associated core domain-containing protein [Pseudomonas sp. WJP1]WCM49821.1 RHS repeat-associated core domain-containing protein [Pseudomonas sp. WJP1]
MTSSPREAVLCHYHYDPLDRLISHVLADTPERQRFYCKSRLSTEIQGAIRYSIVQNEEQLLAQQRSEGDAPETTLLVTDQQRSVLHRLKANHPPQPIAYSPYGHRPVGSGLLSLLGFNGERPDPVTGCYLLGNGYRAFNPVLMRFNSPDSFSPFEKGGINAYAYCGGNPVNRTDPTGHSWVDDIIDEVITKIPLGKEHLKKTIAKNTAREIAENTPPALRGIDPPDELYFDRYTIIKNARNKTREKFETALAKVEELKRLPPSIQNLEKMSKLFSNAKKNLDASYVFDLARIDHKVMISMKISPPIQKSIPTTATSISNSPSPSASAANIRKSEQTKK